MGEKAKKPERRPWQDHVINVFRALYIVLMLPLLAYAGFAIYMVVLFGATPDTMPLLLTAVPLPGVVVWVIRETGRCMKEKRYGAAFWLLVLPVAIFLFPVLGWLATWSI